MALNPIQKVQRGFQQQVVAPTNQAPVFDDTRTQLLQGLSKFASSASEMVGTIVQQKIESDKITQSERAAKDMMATEKERQGITQDSTVAGQLAYNAIIGKHDTMEAGNSFVEWYRANADADEKTVSAKKKELYDPLLSKYGTDPLTLKQVSLQVQESQFAVAAAQEGIKQEHRQKKAVEAIGISVGDLLADPRADIDHIVDTEIPARAKALGLDEFTYKDSLLKSAASRAASGDARLLSKLESTDWSKGSSELERARNQYESFVAKENAVAIGNAKADIMIAAENGESWGSILGKVSALNAKYPESFSAEAIASMKVQRAHAAKVAAFNTQLMKASSDPIKDENAIPLGLNSNYTPSEKDKHIKAKEAEWSKKSQDLVSSGMPEADALAAITKEKVDWSKVNRMTVPSLKDGLTALVNMNPKEDFVNGDLPAYVSKNISLIQGMDDTTLDMYFTNKEDKTMALNIRSSLKNRDPFNAFKRAYDIRRTPQLLSRDAQQLQEEDAATSVMEKLTTKWYKPLTSSQGILAQGTRSSVPEWQLPSIIQEVAQEAKLHQLRGGTDTKANADYASNVIISQKSQTFNGTLINQSKPQLAQSMGVPVQETDKYLGYYASSLLPEMIKEYGSELTVDDISFDVAPNGTSFTIMHKGADGIPEQLGGRHLFSDVAMEGKKLSNEEWAAYAKEQEAVRSKSRSELDRKQTMPSDFDILKGGYY